MPTFDLSNPVILREIIMDHYSNPRNKKEVSDPSFITVHMDSASCIDDIYIQIKFDKDVIKEVYWHGDGCAISTASTSIMSELILNKTVAEAKKIIQNFYNMLESKDFDHDLLDEAICFINVNKQPSRITCANISYRGLEKIFDSLKGKK